MKKALLIWMCVAISCMAMLGCGKTKEAPSNECYIVFTDEVTGKTYPIRKGSVDDAHIPYDGEVHTFSFEVFHAYNNKSTGEKGRLERDGLNKIVQKPGQYSLVVKSYVGDSKTYDLILIIDEPEKLQPIMKFEPNGAIEYRDGEYYKYKYTGEYRYPIAYAEYNGERLEISGEAFLSSCIPSYAPTTDIAAPVKVGVYRVCFSISKYIDDPESLIYKSISQVITVEIVE